MNILYERVEKPASGDLERMRSLYEANFPPAERKPFAYFVPRILTGDYLCMVARLDNESSQVIAFAFLMLLPTVPLAFLEYVAVDEEFRGQGVGSALFGAAVTWLQETGLALGVVWEVEPPTDDETDDRNRRIRFYERLGAKMIALSTPYAMPNYESRAGGVALRIMQLPLDKQPSPVEMSAIVQGIYQVAYPEWGTLRDEILQALSMIGAEEIKQVKPPTPRANKN